VVISLDVTVPVLLLFKNPLWLLHMSRPPVINFMNRQMAENIQGKRSIITPKVCHVRKLLQHSIGQKMVEMTSILLSI
jgi:hypothetical protein